MAVTHTNRQGITYTLCRVTTKAGKAHYAFRHQPREEIVDTLPPDHRISESVNGVVSLVKDAPEPFPPEKLASVEAPLRRHPRGDRYRVVVRRDRIEVFEQIGPDVDEVIADFGPTERLMPAKAAAARERFARRARYAPLLRFRLIDAATRTFGAERRSSRGRGDQWLHVTAAGPIADLAPRVISTLGTDRFFELW